MIIRETVTINNREFVRTYSDIGMMIRKIGTEEMYSEAVDPVDIDRVYEETDILIPVEEMDETEEKAKAYDILMGVSE